MAMKALSFRSLSVLVITAALTICSVLSAVPGSQASDTIELRFSFPFPQQDDMWIGAQYMVSELEKRTNGKVKITPYFSSSLGKLKDSLSMVNYGVAEITLFPPAMFPQVFRIIEALGIPTWQIPDMKVCQKVMDNLYKEGLLDKDLKGYKLLLYEATDPMGFAFKSKTTSLADLRKLKIRTPPGITGKALEELGCSTISLPTTGIYLALDRGVADGVITGPGSYFSAKLGEVAPYCLDFPFGTGACITIMSQKQWEKLPDDIKTIWEKVNKEAMQYYLDQMKIRYPDQKKRYDNAGATLYPLGPEQASLWLKQTEALAQKWIKDTEAKKYPAKKAVDVIKATVAEYSGK